MRSADCTFLLFAFGVTITTGDQVTNGVKICSSYSFGTYTQDLNWKKANNKCEEQENSSLVTMETDEEWKFVKNLTKKDRQSNRRWFIGLERVNRSYNWRWLSGETAWTNGSSAREWRWSREEPNHHKTEHCGEMLSNGNYNNIKCEAKTYDRNTEYISEKQVNCSTVSKTEYIFERAPETSSTSQSSAIKTTATSQRTQFTSAESEDGQTMPSEGVTFENTVRKSSWYNFSFGKINLILIVIVLLAVFILAITVVSGILFCRRHQGRKNQDHLHDRVTCTYEVPPSSELQSIDPVDVQQTQSSTELTVHLTLSQTESGLATYETRSDCKKESEYNDIDETNGKSKSGSEGCSEIQEREREKVMMVGSKKGIEQPPTLCAEKEEKKDNIYAVVHKERKNKVNSEASALKTSLGRPQEEANGLPVNKASGVDFTGRSSHQTDLGLDNIAKAAESEIPHAAGKNEYLYATVDMTTKKKPPQMPPPYRGLVYADLAHTRENSAKLVQEQSQTVYAKIDHVKTASVKISPQNLKETKEGEHK